MTSANILNIDLDFFLNRRVTHVGSDFLDNRANDYGLEVWSNGEVINFLEKELGLNTQKVEGTTVTSHHEVYYQWRQLIHEGKLSVPFSITHVDAHADLGMGDSSWAYILAELLHLPPKQREQPEEGGWRGLNFGNYLAFSIANRWIDKFDFIINPNWRDDIPQNYLTPESKEKKGASLPYATHYLEIELKRITENDKKNIVIGRSRFDEVAISTGEPKIPLNIIRLEDLQDRKSKIKWDYIFLSQSPGYTPTSADALIPIIQSYINQI